MWKDNSVQGGPHVTALESQWQLQQYMRRHGNRWSAWSNDGDIGHDQAVREDGKNVPLVAPLSREGGTSAEASHMRSDFASYARTSAMCSAANSLKEQHIA
jgi:hypothetical protein